MNRSLVPVLGIAAALLGLVRLGRADSCPPPAPFVGLECNLTGTMVNGQDQLTFPRVNPALLQASDFDLELDVWLSGTVTVSFTCPPCPECGPARCNYGFYGPTPVLSNSPASPISFTITGYQGSGSGDRCPDGQTCTTTFPWAEELSGTIAQDYDSTLAGFNPSLPAVFTGTDEVTIGIVESIPEPYVSGGADFIDMSVDPSPYRVDLYYIATPAAVPEPSLWAVTAGLFGLIIMRRIVMWKRPWPIRLID